jgi:hypothetical protein
MTDLFVRLRALSLTVEAGNDEAVLRTFLRVFKLPTYIL